MSISVKDIAWVAGILEGEGTFCLNNDSPRLAVAMTDLDVIEHVRNIVDKTKIISSHFEPESKDGFKRKTRYTFTIVGNIAIQWMMTIYPLMSLRRKSQIRESLHYWRIRGTGKKSLAHARAIKIIANARGLSIEDAEKLLLEKLFAIKEN